MAFSGAGCTSTINPSAPIATPAFDTAGTRLRFPVAWLGSRITGKCVNSFNAGIAAMSQVFRVTVSNIRIPVRYDIFGAHQQFLDRRTQPALQQNRPPALSQRL